MKLSWDKGFCRLTAVVSAIAAIVAIGSVLSEGDFLLPDIIAFPLVFFAAPWLIYFLAKFVLRGFTKG